MIQIIAGICVLGGGIFVFIAGLGILKLPDVLNRMHASTKAGTLGSALTLVAAALHLLELSQVDDFRLHSATLEDLYLHFANGQEV